MIAGILTIELRMPGNSSLKEKRMVVKSLKDKVHVDQALSKVVDFIKGCREVDLINYNMELL